MPSYATHALLAILLPTTAAWTAEVRFAVAADFHVTGDAAPLSRCAQAAAARGAAWLWAVGDLLEDGSDNRAWQRWTDAVNQSPIPVHAVPGNHDVTGSVSPGQPALLMDSGVLASWLGCATPRRMAPGGLPALAMCSTWPQWGDYQAQVDWLGQQLAMPGPAEVPLFVVNHFPPDQATVSLLDGRRPVLWLSGHLHNWQNRAKGGAWNLGSPFHKDGFWLIDVDGVRIEAERCDAKGKGLAREALSFDAARRRWTSAPLPVSDDARRPKPTAPAATAAVPPLQARSWSASPVRLPDAPGARARLGALPRHGVLRGSVPDLRYIAEPGFQGEDSFTFAQGDGLAVASAATVAIAVTALAAPPAACADGFVGTAGGALAGSAAGHGWGGPWQATAGRLAADELALLPGLKRRQVVLDPAGQRPLPRTFGPAAGELWLAVALRERSPKTAASIQLLDHGKPVLTLHLERTAATWFLDRDGTPESPAKGEEDDGSNSDSEIGRSQHGRIWLLRVRFTPSVAEVALWPDPDRYEPPGTGCMIWELPAFACDGLGLAGTDLAVDGIALAEQAVPAMAAVLIAE